MVSWKVHVVAKLSLFLLHILWEYISR